MAEPHRARARARARNAVAGAAPSGPSRLSGPAAAAAGGGREVRAVCLEGLRLGRGRHSCQKTWNLNGAAATVLGIKGGSVGGKT